MSLRLRRSGSFNPCSSGKATGRRAAYAERGRDAGFQSLFFWKSYWKLTRGGVKPTEAAFQSLFFWKSYWKNTAYARACMRDCVSILVLLEKLLEVKKRLKLLTYLNCFNPCSSGKATGSIKVERTQTSLCGFQSLFFWKSYWKYSKFTGR